MRYSKKRRKSIAYMLFLVLLSQLLIPNVAMALTTGPSQPEMQSFEPVGTTDMVDMFSGDFVYNIPLMDVEGYPVNISYHGGITMEQEASWVGLGWNINPGEINRSVRGIPDDFNGDTLSKELNILDDKTLRVGVGAGIEAFGVGDPLLSLSASLGANITFNNYRGTSADFNLGCGINLFHCASVGLNIGVGSQTGAEVDYDANLSLSSANTVSQDLSAGVGVGVSQGFSSRSGLKDMSLTVSASLSSKDAGSANRSMTKTIPIGLQNFVPAITNSNTMNSYYGRIKLGGELFWFYGYGTINGMFSKVHFNNDGSRDAYGYLHLQDAKGSEHKSILDFTRDKDGSFNKTMQYLPPASLTYDIYTVSGQGTGGMFRPYRNDIGSVYDPSLENNDHSYSLAFEGGIGWIFEIGGDFTKSKTEIKAGPWADYLRGFTSTSVGSLYENVYFKEGGELSAVDPQYFSDINRLDPIDPDGFSRLPATKANSSDNRDPRGNLIYYNTAEEAVISGVGTNPDIVSYTSTTGFSSGAVAATTTIDRIGTSPLGHKKGEISEIIQVQKDGRKFIYGIPALNHIQKEATFSVNPPSSTDLSTGLVNYAGGDNTTGNLQGMEHYYSSTITPSFAHSYLLTTVESADYVDVTGNGPTDDDLGAYTKMNYTLKEPDYRWKAPFESGKAQYNPGFWSEPRDDKGSYLCGSREEWLLHSIETKNFVAEFYTSKRIDGCGSTEAIVTSGCYNEAPYNTSCSAAASYMLDSIKLYNKHDRFINKTNAVPVKTVFFTYDYSLCKGIPNVTSGSAGKLTLSKIYFRYGNSERSMISPYQFSYGYNPDYDLSCKDRWGNYKPNPLSAHTTNYEYPFVDQSDTLNNKYATAWSLTGISLPSGGMIQASYEADDYAYVQDKVANEMFVIQGIGNGSDYNKSTNLYANLDNPYFYIYFKRRQAAENSRLSFRDNYLSDTLIYYNFNVQLNNGKPNSYEQIKGYTRVADFGICGNDNNYGYIRLYPVTAKGGDGNIKLNPITYTALNTARYSLPQIVFSGTSSDPDEFSFSDILEGLRESFGELVDIFKGVNIINDLVDTYHDAQSVNIDKSFIRLLTPGLKKKGGGQRVKSLLFFDSWNALAGGNEQDATYGKNYDYTIKDDTYGTISSGVASYEPMVGGDENPFRHPVPFLDHTGSNWPPNDPVSLYQETPIGESLFPSASVGYRKVTVNSIHSKVGKSSQGIDIYQFYTAKDFPVQVKSTAINTSFDQHYDFFSQSNDMKATQGYSLVFNDMHGKPKSVEHYVHRPRGGSDELISYQIYNYKTSEGLLDNNVNCLVYDKSSKCIKVQNKQLGVEADVTVDTRQRNEETVNNTYNFNVNVSGFLFIIIPIFFSMPYSGHYKNDFSSATITKVVQQYGILDNVQAFNEGAVTTQKNEFFDPETGQVVVTSVNNEYQDKEFTVNMPAYWGFKGMAPAYNTIKYETTIPSLSIDAQNLGMYVGPAKFNVGDQLLLDYDQGGSHRQTVAWFMGAGTYTLIARGGTSPCTNYILPRFPSNTPGWTGLASISNVHVKVISSGNKNMLNETIENYTMLDTPIDGSGNLKLTIENAINIKAKTFSDSNTKILHRYIAHADTINPYTIGERGVYKELSDYAYVSNRNYSGTTSRTAGLFPVTALYSDRGYTTFQCVKFPYNYLAPSFSNTNWRVARTVTKWSPFGKEVENLDAVGNFSSAIYGYNQELPVAVAANARQGEVLADGFEDYSLLHAQNNIMDFGYSPFSKYFASTVALSPTSPLYNLLKLSNPGDLSIVSDAHTGNYSLSVPSAVGTGGVSGAAYGVSIPVNNSSYAGMSSHYNSYIKFFFTADDEYLPFKLGVDKKYVLSYWIKQTSPAPNLTTYVISDSCGVKIDGTLYHLVKKSNIIDGWQQVEATFSVPIWTTTATLRLPIDYNVDDIRFFPSTSNMKAFVYNPANEKLMSTLDENNFATLYEYDQEGNLVRVKKETEKGIMTVSESRSNNPLQ